MKNYFLVLCMLLGGCIRDELPSSEADIVDFALTDVELLSMNINANSIYIMVSSKDESKLVNILPKIKLSQGASISPDSTTPVNLNDVEYVVTSENGSSTKKYTITIAREYDSDTVRFPFNDWKTTTDGFHQLSDANWSSGNAGITMALGILERVKVPENYPTQIADAAHSGRGAKLVTTQGGIIFGAMNVAVWAGSFFLGNFNTAKVITPLLATEFGRVYKRKPHTLRGWYKYEEGAGDYVFSYSKDDPNTHTIPDKRDSCAIYAVFYLSDGVTLDATTIDNHQNIIARADIANSAGGGSTTNGEWREFNLDFRYRNADFVMDTLRQYKLAIVFSSSARGGTPKQDDPSTVVYAGKIGSTLLVDEVEVINY